MIYQFTESQKGLGCKGPWQGHFPPDHVAPTCVQPGLEHYQGWASHSFSEQIVPMPHILLGKNVFLISNIYPPTAWTIINPVLPQQFLMTTVPSPVLRLPVLLWVGVGSCGCSPLCLGWELLPVAAHLQDSTVLVLWCGAASVLWHRQETTRIHFSSCLALCLARKNSFGWLCSFWLALSWLKFLELKALEILRRSLEQRIEAISKIITWFILELHDSDLVKNNIAGSEWISSEEQKIIQVVTCFGLCGCDLRRFLVCPCKFVISLCHGESCVCD